MLSAVGNVLQRAREAGSQVVVGVATGAVVCVGLESVAVRIGLNEALSSAEVVPLETESALVVRVPDQASG